MRWLWTALAAVVIAGGVALWWPQTAPTAPSASEPAVTASAPTVLHDAPKASGGAPPPASPALSSSSAPSDAPAPASGPSASVAFQPQRLPDGTLRLDQRFAIGGSGSEQDPLRLTWPLLASAADTVDAASDRLTPPAHIQFLNGQWVQISAFLAPPLWGERTTELLVMKNRWDGCCIGLPPTPFDCIEASLATPIMLGAKHSISYGTVRGRLVVQPFTAGMFLLGLYRLEQAQIEDMKGQ